MQSVYSILPSLIDCGAARTVLEIGAHTGGDSARLRMLFPRADMYCFEPDPRNAAVFRASPLGRRVELVEAALAERDGHGKLHLSSGHPQGEEHWRGQWSASSSLKRPLKHLETFPWCRFEYEARVRLLRLDTFVAARSIESIDFIWADVQGAEDLLIAGGPCALAATRYLYTEYCDQELYEGQLPLERLLGALPGRWSIVQQYPGDVLLRNDDHGKLAAAA